MKEGDIKIINFHIDRVINYIDINIYIKVINFKYMVNPVGSLTQFQKSLIIGTILGDGYLRIVPGRKNAFLEINHSFSQKEYVDWKFDKLHNICVSKPKVRRGNGNRIAYRFYTRQSPELTQFYNSFYKNGKKIIPDNLELNAVVLSAWFMDDGSKCGESFYLNTQQFNKDYQVKLLNCLKKFNLEAGLNKDKSYYRIRFASSSINTLKELLKENLILPMYYKIGL